ncbi:WD40 repeat domain-containing protein [Bacteroidota bacterium]
MKKIYSLVLVLFAINIIAQDSGPLKYVNCKAAKHMFRDEDEDNIHIDAMQFSPDGKTLAVSVNDDIKFFDPMDLKETEKSKNMYHYFGSIKTFRYSKDGKKIAYSGYGIQGVKTVALADDVKNGKYKVKRENVDFEYSPDGKTLAIAEDGITIFDTESGKKVKEIGNDDEFYYNLSYDPTGKYIAGSIMSKTEIYDIESGEIVSIIEGKGKDIIFTPKGDLLVFIGYSGDITVWDVATGEKKDEVYGFAKRESHQGNAFSPDGKYFFTGTQYKSEGYTDKTIRLVWDGHTFNNITCAESDDDDIFADYITVSPDGKYIAFKLYKSFGPLINVYEIIP